MLTNAQVALMIAGLLKAAKVALHVDGKEQNGILSTAEIYKGWLDKHTTAAHKELWGS